jgi:hypothetical protein
MWPNNFWADNFWADNFWSGSAEVTVPNIILIDGYTSFGIITDSQEDVPRGRVGGKLISPIQDSYGGLIRLQHDFPYLSGNTAKIGYESPEGAFGELSSYSFDGTTVTAFIPDGLLNTEGTSWKFNIIVSGTRNGQAFSIRSKLLQISVFDGLIDESI